MKAKDDDPNPRLADIVEPYIKARSKDKVIYPAVIAEMVMRDLDKGGLVKTLYPTIYFASHHAFRQTARQILRRRYPRGGGMTPETEREAPIPGLEIDRLQRRYPQAHAKEEEDGGRGYILREEMSEADWLWNLGQFDKDIAGRQRHREQFKRWGMKVKGWVDPDVDIGFGERERC